MTAILAKTRQHFLPALVLLTISLFALKDSFKLGLYGDDWLVLYIFLKQTGPAVGDSYFNLINYLNPYGPTYLFMGILQNFFGFNSLPYFIVSFLTRSIVVVSLYWFLLSITKNKSAGFIGALFFAVSEIGLESTNWVFNFNSYIGLGLFLLFLSIYYKVRTFIEWPRQLILPVLLFALSVIIVPVRMHGAFLLLILLEIWIFIERKNFKALKITLLMSLVWTFIFIGLQKQGVFGGGGNFEFFVVQGVETRLNLLKEGRFEHLLYPITTIGNMLFPDKLMEEVQIPRIIFKIKDLSWMKSFLIPLWLFFVFIASVFSHIFAKQGKKWKTLIAFSLGGFFWIVILRWVINFSPTTFNNPNLIFLTTIGGFWLILVLGVILSTWKSDHILSRGLLFSLFWFLTFAAVPIAYSPNSPIASSMRYMIIPGVSLPLFLGFMMASKITFDKKFLLGTMFLPLLLIQLISSQKYLSDYVHVRGSHITNTVWSQLLQQTPKLSEEKPTLFYFEPTQKTNPTVRDVITFGFAGRMVLEKKVSEKVGGPYALMDFNELVSAVTDGESLRGQNWGDPLRFSWSQVYAFRLEDNYALVDIKEEVMKKVENSTTFYKSSK